MRKLIVIIIAFLLVVCLLFRTPFKSEVDTGPQVLASEALPSLIVQEDHTEPKPETKDKAAADDDSQETATVATCDEKARVPDDTHEVVLDSEPNQTSARKNPASEEKQQESKEKPNEKKNQSKEKPSEGTAQEGITTEAPVTPALPADSSQVDKAKDESNDKAAAELPKDEDLSGQSKTQDESDDSPHPILSPHIHNFSLTSLSESGCTEKGSKVYTCLCGESYEEPIDALGHDWVLASEHEVVDKESYCSFKYARIICTSPVCYENGDRTGTPLSVFSAKDYGYMASEMFEAYDAHAYDHLTKGEQASYTADFIKDTAPADLYDLLLSQQNSKPKSIRDLTLVPAVTHTEQVYRCTKCGAEK